MKDGVAEQRRSLAPLWVMIAVFAAPIIAAWFFYFNPEYLPSGRANKGELIEPVIPLSAGLGLITPEGTEFDLDRLAGRWTLVYLAAGECGTDCSKHLIAMRQIRLALGQSQLSMERLLVLTDPTAKALAEELAAELDGMQVALINKGDGALEQSLGEGALGRIYILDPMGNLMMRYAADAPAKDTLTDMERLLKASANWIKGSNYGHN